MDGDLGIFVEEVYSLQEVQVFQGENFKSILKSERKLARKSRGCVMVAIRTQLDSNPRSCSDDSKPGCSGWILGGLTHTVQSLLHGRME